MSEPPRYAPAMEHPVPQLTVADVVAVEALGLVVHAGRSALGNPIDVAHVSEVAHATELVERGEFLMTTGSELADTAEAWEAYVAHFAAGGAAALALGVGESQAYRAMPACLVMAAERHGVPLLEVPASTPFIAVSKAIYAARSARDREALERSFEFQRDLTRVAARERGLSGLIQAWHAATGEEALILDRRGRTLATTQALAGDSGRQISAAALELHQLTSETIQVMTEVGPATVTPLGATRHAGYLARVGEISELGALAAPTLTSLLALEFERRWLLDEPQRRMRANQFARLLAAGDESQAIAQLRALGIRAGTLRAVALRAANEAQAEELLADLTMSLGTGLARRRATLVEVIASVAPHQVLAEFAPAVPTGIGTPVPVGLIARSLRQAQSALATSVQTGSTVEYREGAAHEFLLAIADPEYLASFADSVLSPIEQADNGLDLIETLHAWLEEERSVASCSERLGVHRHTVRNRLQRITQLLGRSLDTVETQTELWLALKARGIRDEHAGPR